MFKEQKAPLFLNNVHITGDTRKQIALHHQGHNLEETIQKSLRIHSKLLETMEWEGIEVAYTKLPISEKISRMKIMHNCLPTRALLYIRNGPNSSRRPRCNNRKETYAHIFQCTCPQNKSNHRMCMKKFRENLRRANTHVLIINAFDMLLTNFHQNRTPRYTAPPLGDTEKILLVVQQVFTQQSLLGKEAFVRDFITRNWMMAQNALVRSNKPDAKDLPRLKKIIRAIWEYSHSIWVLRCKQVHSASKNDPENLTHQELVFSVRPFLRISRRELSTQEKLTQVVRAEVSKRLTIFEAYTSRRDETHPRVNLSDCTKNVFHSLLLE